MWTLRETMRETVWMACLVIVLMVLAVFSFFELPLLVVSAHDLQAKIPSPAGATASPAPTAVDLIQARNGVRTAAVALIAGLGAALAAGFAARTYYLSRRGQTDERYADAQEQLGTADEAVRVSAIVELEQIARECPARRRQVTQVLTAFVRRRGRQPDEDAAPPSVQAACTSLARLRGRRDRGLVLDLAGADLRRVSMEKANLRGAILHGADLRGAFFSRSDLTEARLANAQAQSVRLDGAELQGAHLDGALLQGATLDGAKAAGADFTDATLENTFLRGADLRTSTGLPVDGDAVAGGVIDASTKLPGPRRPRYAVRS